jgi:two-component system cell cycle response regulator
MPEPLRVLLVEDNPGDAHLVERTLEEVRPGRFRLAWVTRLADGIATLTEDPYTVVLLDLNLPDARGLDALRRLRTESGREIPVVVLTGEQDEEQAIAAVGAGAQEYLVKDEIRGALLARAISHAVERHRMQERLLQAALRDDLTGAYNRRGFLELGRHRVDLARRRGEHLAVLVADVDGLKAVNDSLGHAQGSRLICDVAGILLQTARRSDVVARLGGDEFAVLLTGPEGAAGALTRRIRDAVDRTNARGDRPYRISLSLGAAVVGPDGELDLDRLLEEADRRMYEEKRARSPRGAARSA